MPYGTPGADVQPKGMIQFLAGTLDLGLDVDEAFETSLAATCSYPNTYDPHVYRPGLAATERRASKSVIEGLAARTHKVELRLDRLGSTGSGGAVMKTSRGAFSGEANPGHAAYGLGQQITSKLPTSKSFCGYLE